MSRLTVGRVAFVAGAILVLAGWAGPPLALSLGIAFAMLFEHPFEIQSQRASKLLLQCSIVALGFGMNLREVAQAGRSSFVYTAVGICLSMALGTLLGKMLKVRSKAAFLITVGTAICGGSAIAAIAPITKPDQEDLAASLGTVFTLNSIALLLFPFIGAVLHLTQTQFGLWSALAIHDTSSVVAAAAKYGPQALAVGTVVKLTRALWIIPVALLTASFTGSRAALRFPWFILLFCVAAVAKGWLPGSFSWFFTDANQAGHIGLALTLFLIGTGISLRTIRRAGGRTLIQGVTLWILVASASLAAIRLGWVRL